MLWIRIRRIRKKLASWIRIHNYEFRIRILTIYQRLNQILIKYNFDNIFFKGTQFFQEDPDPAGSLILFPLGSGSWNQDNLSGNPYPDPKEIFRDPQHWCLIFLDESDSVRWAGGCRALLCCSRAEATPAAARGTAETSTSLSARYRASLADPDQRHILRDRRPSTTACPACWATVGTKELK